MTIFKASRYKPRSQAERVKYCDPDKLYSQESEPVWNSETEEEEKEAVSQNKLPHKNSIIEKIAPRDIETVTRYTQEDITQFGLAADLQITQSAISHRLKKVRRRAEFFASLPAIYHDRPALEALAHKYLEDEDARILIMYLYNHNQSSVGLAFKLSQPQIRYRLNYTIRNALKNKDKNLYELLDVFIKTKKYAYPIKYSWVNRTAGEATLKKFKMKEELKVKRKEERIQRQFELENLREISRHQVRERAEEILERCRNYTPEFLAFCTPYMRDVIKLRLANDRRACSIESLNMLRYIHLKVEPRYKANLSALEALPSLDVPEPYKEAYRMRLNGSSLPEIAREMNLKLPAVQQMNFKTKLKLSELNLQLGSVSGEAATKLKNRLERISEQKTAQHKKYREKNGADIVQRQQERRAVSRRKIILDKIAKLQEELKNLYAA